jgi:hypothetical protein
MSTTIREASAGSRRSREQDFMGKRLAPLAIRLLMSVNLLYAAIILKFAGVPGSVILFTQMSQAVHGLVSQPVFRLGSGAFETVVAILLLISKTARLGARLTVVWDDCRNSQSHFRVGIRLVLCRRSHGDGAGRHLSFADTHAIRLGRTRKYGGDGRRTNGQKIVGRRVALSGSRLRGDHH